MAVDIWLLVICIIGGFIIGIFSSFRGYKKKVMEVLDFLKFTKNLSNEEYEHYKTKFVDKQDTLKSIKTTMGILKKKEE